MQLPFPLTFQFSIKGVDYQPGGSSGYFGRSDPLSDLDSCARDVFLFQQLGLNTIRVYTINPDLNHDECMTLLAAAGIYLILDVNSPRVGESLHRYEPWTTFNRDYFSHIFKVVHQFSSYNNTLGFFAGNEIVNDESSAMSSPHYVKAVVRDLKSYMEANSLRQVPVGYSAADDLRYRTSLAKYLECGDESMAVDFYGVNSYQWCGVQSLTSSGYDVLINDYKEYSLPMFLSEYGCNAVTPRVFQEVTALYSTAMMSVFSGGLVYEFTQGPNNYGLVEMDHNGDVYLRQDFGTLKERLNDVGKLSAAPPKSIKRPNYCLGYYDNLYINPKLPDPVDPSLIYNGVPGAITGNYLQNISLLSTSHRIFTFEETEIMNKRVMVTDSWKAQMRKGVGLKTPQQPSPESTDKNPSKWQNIWSKVGLGDSEKGTKSLLKHHRGDKDDTSAAGSQARGGGVYWQLWIIQVLATYIFLATVWAIVFL